MMIDIDLCLIFFFFKQETAYEMRISDWSSDVCSSDLGSAPWHGHPRLATREYRGNGQEAGAGTAGLIHLWPRSAHNHGTFGHSNALDYAPHDRSRGLTGYGRWPFFTPPGPGYLIRLWNNRRKLKSPQSSRPHAAPALLQQPAP